MTIFEPKGTVWGPVRPKPKEPVWPGILAVIAILILVASCSGTRTAEAEPTGETVNR